MDENYAADKGVFNAGAEFQRRERKDLGSVTEAARDIPVFAHTDVLVVGGGPAGTTAAVAAARKETAGEVESLRAEVKAMGLAMAEAHRVAELASTPFPASYMLKERPSPSQERRVGSSQNSGMVPSVDATFLYSPRSYRLT